VPDRDLEDLREQLLLDAEEYQRAMPERQRAEIAELKKQLEESRLDALAVGAEKNAFVAQSRDVAMSLARALELIEIAYHAGNADGRSGIDPDKGYRAFEKQLRDAGNKEPRKEPAKA
jgi:hypothetical protein